MMSRSSKNGPIVRVDVMAVDGADNPRLQSALTRIAGHDTTVSISAHPQEDHYALEGMTVSDLDLICDRLRDEYHLAMNVGSPSAILLESVRKHAEAEGKYIRQTGGSGNYGHCKLRVEPNTPGAGYEFINDIKGGVVPKEYIKPIDQGIQGAMELGILAGFQMVDIKVTLFGGSYHEVDSNEMAFKFAGSIAFKEAARKAAPVLLEPIMAIEMAVPEKLSNATRSEIHAHRGRVESHVTLDGFCETTAVVPLSELLVSDSPIASWPMTFVGYEPVPDKGSSDENGPGVTANRPHGPRPVKRSEMAAPEDD